MITSTGSSQVKRVIQLQKKSKIRKENRQFVVEGVKMVCEAPFDRIEKVYMSERFATDNEDFVKKLGMSDDKVETVADNVFAHMSDTQTPQGVMAVINMKYPIDHALVTTYQAISGAGKTFETWPEMVDNLIPYIGGEEMKSEVEPNKVLGKIEGKEIVPSNELSIECQTYRVPVSNGHTAAIFFSFKDGVNKPSVEEIEKMWADYSGEPQKLNLPHAPKQFIHVYTEKDQPDQPQIKTAREIDGGMAISCGRLRESNQYDYKMVSMSHNTLRGAAGGAVLLAELLTAKGYMD